MKDPITIHWHTDDGQHGTIETDIDLAWDMMTDADKIAYAEMDRGWVADIRANPCPPEDA